MLRRSIEVSVISQVLLTIVVPALMFQSISHAADLTNRSITIDSPNTSATTEHDFRFTTGTAGLLGSVAFEYCSNSPLASFPCVAPAGLDVQSSSLAAQSGALGFSIHPSTTANRLVIGRVPAVSGAGVVSYDFDNVLNPSTNKQTVYVRISTYAAADGTGAATDQGAVAFATASGLGTHGYVPPFLRFCVGVTVSGDCSSFTGNYVDFSLFSPTQPSAGTTQMAAATNDFGGYNIFVLGTTMTAGNVIIPALTTPQPSVTGTSQFGMNLRANSAPTVGQDISGAGLAAPTANYNNPNLYLFNNGDLVASRAGTADYNVYTVSYIINVAPTQSSGRYSTTLTYMATAAF